jgi:hypothetical protein
MRLSHNLSKNNIIFNSFFAIKYSIIMTTNRPIAFRIGDLNVVTVTPGDGPPISYNLMGRTTYDRILNKTLTDFSNTIAAKSIYCGSTLLTFGADGAVGEVLTRTANGVEFTTAGTGDVSLNGIQTMTNKSFSDSVAVNTLTEYTAGVGVTLDNIRLRDTTGTTTTASFEAVGAAVDIDVVLLPKGTGGILADIPDGTAAGGDARGTYSIDLQMTRTLSTQVASGIYSVITGGINNTNAVSYGYIGGGSTNQISGGNYATICGGFTNSISAVSTSCNIGGGENNSISGINATVSVIAGGGNNTIVARGATIAGGSQNQVLGQFSTVCGGGFNIANDQYCFIGGGNNCTTPVAGIYDTICGGQNNAIASGSYSTLCGGGGNSITGSGSTIGGGQAIVCTATNGTVGGGLGNQVTNSYSTISGGRSNTCAGAYDTVSGGWTNTIPAGDYSVICGGRSNTINASIYNTVGGGFTNQISGAAQSGVVAGGITNTIVSGNYSTISGGQSNTITGAGSTIGGGQSIICTAVNGTVSGGVSNQVTANYATIAGGRLNVCPSGYGTICGGYTNTMVTPGNYCFIGGGNTNTITGAASINGTITGGESCSITSALSGTISGGSGCFITNGRYSVIGGGQTNSINTSTAAKGHHVVIGGLSNDITDGNSSVICGGDNNAIAIGNYSAILSGNTNSINGTTTGQNVILGGSNCSLVGSLNLAYGTTCTTTGTAAKCVVLGNLATSAVNGAFVYSDSTAATAATGADSLTIGVNGGATIYSNTLRTTGVTMATGASAWSAVSDRNMKTGLVELDSRDILDRVGQLSIYEFSYKDTDSSVRWRGPMAQDWHSLFPSKKDPLRIDTLDLDGITLAAVKGLLDRVKILEAALGI